MSAREPRAPAPLAVNAAALPGTGTTTVRLGTSARVAARQTLCPNGVHDYRRIDGVRTCRLCGDIPPTL